MCSHYYRPPIAPPRLRTNPSVVTLPATISSPLKRSKALNFIMGEQTQSRPKSQPPTSHPPPPASVTEQPTPSDLPQNPPNPSKIPIRPPKIRKLSSTDITDINAAILTTTTNTNNNNKNKRRCPSNSPPLIVIKPLSSDGEIDLALRHLRAADPLLANLIDTLAPPAFQSHSLPFVALAKSILYQQLAYKAGTTIYNRFLDLCGGEEAVRPNAVLSLTTEQLKQIGVSSRKASYLYDLANKYKNGILTDDSIVKMDDKSLFTMLSMVKGIGIWSVHMFMIFSLHRPDVLPVSDLGVRKGVQLLYGLEELPRPSQMEQLCDKWRPYRSVGAWYMWRFVEGKGTPTAVALEGGAAPQQQIEHQQEAHPQQHQLQLLEPINGIGNLGACIWGQ